jgi:hypothetical protein
VSSPRKRPGRPPRGDKAATERIEIRVTKLEILEWKRAAELAGVTLSEWISQTCNKPVRVLAGLTVTIPQS